MSSHELSLAPLTALDAVNEMLRSIGQGTISSIEFSESVDAENAKAILHDTSRKVQSRGWWFNRERDYPLLPNSDGHIVLPAVVLKFAPGDRARGVVNRGAKLYDTKNHTDVFEQGKALTADITFFLAFEELPQDARNYIAARAGRLFQIGAVGSDLLYRFTREMEQDALVEMTRAHIAAERPNLIYDDPRTSRTARGGRYWSY